MFFSKIVTAAALLVACQVSAAPVEKRDMVVVTDYVTDITMKTVTAYEGAKPTAPAKLKNHYTHVSHSKKKTHHHHTKTTKKHHHKKPKVTSAAAAGYEVYTYTYVVGEQPTEAAATPVYTQAPAPVYTQAPAPVYTEAPVETPTPTPEPTQAPTTSSGSDGTTEDWQKTLLDAHNKYRAMHGAEALVWNQTLSDFGYENTADCVMEHTQPYTYGENLAWGADPQGAVDMWYNEITAYKAAPGAFSMSTGHFTQLVWKATTQLGCGYRTTCSAQYIKCEYSIGGNMEGDFEENVQI